MTERTLPYSQDAERAALGSVLIRPTAWDELADMATDDFLSPIHREIFDAMRALAGRKRTIDIVSLSDELKARGMYGRLPMGEVYLVEMTNAVGSSESIGNYANAIVAKATLRRTIAACMEVASRAYGNVEDIEEFLAETRATFGSIEMRGSGGFVKIGDDLTSVIDTIGNRCEKPTDYIVNTGISALDKAIGGLRGTQLVVVGGNPGHGKTALAWDFLLNAAADGVPCALISMEMKRSEMIERAISKHARIDGRKISGGRLDFDEWKRIQDPALQGPLRSAPIWINDRRMTARRVCSEVRRWASRLNSRTKLVAIDYLGLVRNEKEGLNRSRELGEMTEAFKGLAKELDIPVILCAQLNRANTGGATATPRAPRISDLRDSGEIEQAADVVLFPWWEGEPTVGIPHPATIIVGKQRNGPQGAVDCQWEREFTTFSDRDVDRYYPEGADAEI
jgi:replicative DNA helicase